jgi:hypothetical protein
LFSHTDKDLPTALATVIIKMAAVRHDYDHLTTEDVESRVLRGVLASDTLYRWDRRNAALETKSMVKPQTNGQLMLIRPLRSGHDSDVWLAQQHLESKMSRKRGTVLIVKFCDNPEDEAKFWMRAYPELRDFVICREFDHGQRPALIMPRLGLVDFTATGITAPLRQAICEAIAHLAKSGISHDDLSSDLRHVGRYIDTAGVVKYVIFDFGRAHLLTLDESADAAIQKMTACMFPEP